MDTFSAVGTITLLLIFASVILPIFLLTVKTNNKPANRFLAAYLIVFSLHISVFFYSSYVELPLIIEMLRDQIIAFSSPLLFLYLLSNIYADFKLRPIHLVHLLPFVIRVLLFMPGFYLAPESERVLFTDNFMDQPEVKISVIIGILISVVYIVLMFVELRKYKKLLIENYSSTASFNYKWLYQLTLFITFLFLFSQIKQFYRFTGDDLATLNIMRLILTTLLLVFLSWIILKSLYQPELFKAIDTNHRLVETLVKEEAPKEKDTNGTDPGIQSQIEKLRAFMESEEPFLDPDITVQKLAYLFKMPTKEFSILINHHLGQHFFDFIAEYRIKKAITLLEDPANKKLTVLEILYTVGFNSKSPFNKAFKKYTGMTPTQFRKKH